MQTVEKRKKIHKRKQALERKYVFCTQSCSCMSLPAVLRRCVSLLPPGLCKLPSQSFSNGPRNFDNVGRHKEIHPRYPKKDTGHYFYSMKLKPCLNWRASDVKFCVDTALTTSKNVLLPGHNHLLTTSADDLTHHLSASEGDNQSVGSSVLVVSRWLWLGKGTFFEVASMVVTWWIVAFLRSVNQNVRHLHFAEISHYKWDTQGNSCILVL